MTLATDPTEPLLRRCPRGHRLFDGDASTDLCPVCLLGMGLEDEPEPTGFPVRFGAYDLLTKLGEGGGGIVYKARQRSIGRIVALKRMRDGELADAADRRRFLEEVKAAAQLHHPHIVPIHDVGELDGEPYFTMEFMSGGTLKDAAKRFSDPHGAAALISKLARAVHALHTAQAGHPERIIHRDLKPGNILFDERDNPYIADFGIAKRLDSKSGTKPSAWTDEAAGTVHYMAPEQAYRQTKPPTAAADVWSLGVILYELTVGRPPFDGPTPLEVLRCAAEDEPEPLERADGDLSTICLTCLRKEPEGRYISAEALADDLDRYLRDEPLQMRRPGRVTRAFRWCLRHPITAGISLAVGLFLLLMTWGAVSIAREEETSKRAQIQESNQVIAGLVAGSVLSYLRALSDVVHRVAEDQRLSRALEEGRASELDAICKEAYEQYNDPSHGLEIDGSSPFHLWYVQDRAGIAKAIYQMPAENDIRGRDYAFRDYFKGATALAHKGLHQTYVSYAHKSEVDGYYTLPISAPIYGSDGQWRGVLVASVATTAKLGTLVLDDGQHTAVLAAPHGPERTGPSLPDPPEYLILRHPSYSNHGESITLGDDQVRRLGRDSQEGDKHIEQWLELPSARWVRSSDDYEDPLDKGRRRLAGFAPVGHTGFVIIVQSNEGDTLGPEKKLGKRLGRWAGFATIPGVLLVLFAVSYDRRRRARAADRGSPAV